MYVIKNQPLLVQLCVIKQNNMQTILQQPYVSSYSPSISKPSLLARFMTWAKNQNENRFVWLAVILFAHGCFFTPLTLFVITATGNSPVAMAFAIAAMGMSLITNLAALPTTVTVPTFFLSLAIDLGIIISCLAAFL